MTRGASGGALFWVAHSGPFPCSTCQGNLPAPVGSPDTVAHDAQIGGSGEMAVIPTVPKKASPSGAVASEGSPRTPLGLYCAHHMGAPVSSELQRILTETWFGPGGRPDTTCSHLPPWGQGPPPPARGIIFAIADCTCSARLTRNFYRFPGGMTRFRCEGRAGADPTSLWARSRHSPCTSAHLRLWETTLYCFEATHTCHKTLPCSRSLKPL